MSRRQNPAMPSTAFGLLLVEGGDEAAICQILAGPAWSQLCCWKADGRDLPRLAQLARNDPGFGHARSIGVVLDAEHSVVESLRLAEDTLAVFGSTDSLRQGVLAGSPPTGAFLTPDGTSPGALETLCRRAVKNPTLAACVDGLVTCAGSPHASRNNPQVAEDKGWLRAYLAMLSEPDLRLHQAFEHPHGIDVAHPVFDPLRRFLLAL